MSYLNALHDLMDFRKFSGPSGNVLCDFAITDIYLKRAKHLVSRNMRVQWIKDHDETLWKTKEIGRRLKNFRVLYDFTKIALRIF